MYTDNEILFPHYAISALKNLRGSAWKELVEEILVTPENDEKMLAFMLMMIRMNGCLPCETDSYRAMRGCTACAQQTLRRFKGKDPDLLKLFNKALNEVRNYAKQNPEQPILISTEEILIRPSN